MSQTIRVAGATMQGIAEDIKHSADGIQGKLDTMEGSLKPLATKWSGEAQTAFARAKTNWTNDMNDLRALLVDIAQLVVEHGDNMHDSDRRGAGHFSAY